MTHEQLSEALPGSSKYVRKDVCEVKGRVTRLTSTVNALLLAALLCLTSYNGCLRGEFNSHVSAEAVRDKTTASTLEEIKGDVEYIRQNLPK